MANIREKSWKKNLSSTIFPAASGIFYSRPATEMDKKQARPMFRGFVASLFLCLPARTTAVGTAGNFLLMKNQPSVMWIVFALLAALCAAIVVTLSKAGIKNLDSSLAFAVQAVLIVAISWGVVLSQNTAVQLKDIELRTWGFLVVAGVFTTISSLLSFRALKLADASQVNPVERLSLVFAIVFAALFLKEKITWQVVVGALLMAAGAVVIAFAKKPS